MQIKVTNKWYILSDPMNIIVAERKLKDADKVKDGEDREYFVHKSFHGTVSQALRAIFEGEVRRSKAEDWDELLEAVNKQNELLEKICKKLKIKC